MGGWVWYGDRTGHTGYMISFESSLQYFPFYMMSDVDPPLYFPGNKLKHSSECTILKVIKIVYVH